jgi:hypothetical protein
MIMTWPIATEFKLAMARGLAPRQHCSGQEVSLIALIALARRFVILDPDASPRKIAALAGTTPALDVTYPLLRERDDRLAEVTSHARS